ncbi:MAG TPA: DoxX family protein [Noviherbaspirillum sp.]|nr:DoxX family protein [Noviherbaspirillum sp.]
MNHSASDYAATLLRITLGVVLLAHGLLKVLVFTLPGTAGFFASVGFPGWTAYPVTAIEIAGGLALIAGFHSRLVALAVQPVLLGALFVHIGNGWLFSAPNGGWEYPLFLVVAAAVVSLLGDGAFALRRAPAPVRLRTA